MGPPRNGAKPVAKIMAPSSVSSSATTPSRKQVTQTSSIGRMRRSVISGVGLGTSRSFAAPPLVEASAALAAELTGLDLVAQHPRHVGHGAVETGLEHFGDVQANVEADGVGKLDRPHGHAEGFGGGVDGLALLARVEHHQRLE